MSLINFNIDDEFWETLPDFQNWQKFLEELFEETINKKHHGNFSVNLLLTNNETIRDLNRKFRNKNVPTNVLSFPQYDEIDTILNYDKIFLGDIAMSYEKIVQESEEFGIRFFDRCSHLFVHAVLHLFGMDHKFDSEQKEMEDLEIEILEKFEVRNPYILIGEEKKV